MVLILPRACAGMRGCICADADVNARTRRSARMGTWPLLVIENKGASEGEWTVTIGMVIIIIRIWYPVKGRSQFQQLTTNYSMCLGFEHWLLLYPWDTSISLDYTPGYVLNNLNIIKQVWKMGNLRPPSHQLMNILTHDWMRTQVSILSIIYWYQYIHGNEKWWNFLEW